MKKRIQWVIPRACCLMVGCFVATSCLADEGNRQDPREPKQPVLIRLKIEPNQHFRYRLQLAGQVAWTPPVAALDGGRMETDFLFTLRAKTERPNGDWTLDLLGERLISAGRNRKGYFQVDANRNQARAKVDSTRHPPWRVKSSDSLLEKPMTLTLGPRGQIRYGTGWLPLAVYLLPQGDHHFWTLLTTAPEDPVVPGDTHVFDFEVPLPEAKGNPLQIHAEWNVLPPQPDDSDAIVRISLAAQLDLVGTSVLLKNGDQFRVVAGTYRAAGGAVWDVRTGFLRSATADQTLFLTADQPIPRKLRAESRCTLQGLAFGE